MLAIKPPNEDPHVLILTHSDGSGIQAAWGPYPSKAAAEQGQKDLGEWPIESGKWEIRPLLIPLRNVPAGPVYRGVNAKSGSVSARPVDERIGRVR